MLWIAAEVKRLMAKMLVNLSSAEEADQTSQTVEMINQIFSMVKEVICELFKQLFKTLVTFHDA